MQQIEKYQSVIKKNDGKTFWQLQDEDKKANPGKYLNFQDSVAKGKKYADKFLQTCQNPANKEAYADWKGKYKSDPQNVVNEYVKDVIQAEGTKQFIVRDTAYENRLKQQYTDANGQTKKYNTATLEDAHVLKRLADTLTAKHNAVGYEGDEDAVKEYWSNYRLSEETQKNIIR